MKQLTNAYYDGIREFNFFFASKKSLGTAVSKDLEGKINKKLRTCLTREQSLTFLGSFQTFWNRFSFGINQSIGVDWEGGGE